MKVIRKLAFCMAAVMLGGGFALPAAAADDVAGQIKAASGEMYSVNVKALGYTALNGKLPERPEWYIMPESYAERYKDDDAWWEYCWQEYVDSTYPDVPVEKRYGIATYGVSITADGDAVVQDGSTGGYAGFVKIQKMDKNGKTIFDTVLEGVDYARGNWKINDNMLSIADGLYLSTSYPMNYYYDLASGGEFKYLSGNAFYNGYAAVLEADEGITIRDVPQLDYDWEHGTSEPMGSISCRLSIINDKNEKVFTALEPIELVTAYNGGAATEFRGENYTLDVGGYSDGLLGFECDRQLGDTLNELIPNKNAESTDKYQKAEHKCGYTDLNGKIIIPQSFDHVYAFQDGLALVGINADPTNQWSMNWKYGFINKSGEYVIEPIYEAASSFSDGLARVKLDGQWGVIDKAGNFIIEPQYGEWYDERKGVNTSGITDYHNGIAQVAVKDGDEPAKWGYINTKGETILPLAYDDAFGTDGTYFSVGKTVDGAVKYGVVDRDGNTVLPFIFEDITAPVNGTVYAFYNRELYSFIISKANLESGDFDGDGEIGVADAQNVLSVYTKTLSGGQSALTDAQRKACDVNGDGAVDVADAQLILQYYVKNTLSHTPTDWSELIPK